jgi:hypothetical protein
MGPEIDSIVTGPDCDSSRVRPTHLTERRGAMFGIGKKRHTRDKDILAESRYRHEPCLVCESSHVRIPDLMCMSCNHSNRPRTVRVTLAEIYNDSNKLPPYKCPKCRSYLVFPHSMECRRCHIRYRPQPCAICFQMSVSIADLMCLNCQYSNQPESLRSELGLSDEEVKKLPVHKMEMPILYNGEKGIRRVVSLRVIRENCPLSSKTVRIDHETIDYLGLTYNTNDDPQDNQERTIGSNIVAITGLRTTVAKVVPLVHEYDGSIRMSSDVEHDVEVQRNLSNFPLNMTKS